MNEPVQHESTLTRAIQLLLSLSAGRWTGRSVSYTHLAEWDQRLAWGNPPSHRKGWDRNLVFGIWCLHFRFHRSLWRGTVLSPRTFLPLKCSFLWLLFTSLVLSLGHLGVLWSYSSFHFLTLRTAGYSGQICTWLQTTATLGKAPHHSEPRLLHL